MLQVVERYEQENYAVASEGFEWLEDLRMSDCDRSLNEIVPEPVEPSDLAAEQQVVNNFNNHNQYGELELWDSTSITKEHRHHDLGIQDYELLDWSFCTAYKRNLSDVYHDIAKLSKKIAAQEYCKVEFDFVDRFVATTSAIVRLSISGNICKNIVVGLKTPLCERLSEFVYAKIQNRPMEFDKSIPRIGQIYMERHAAKVADQIIREVDPDGLDCFLDKVFRDQLPLPELEEVIR